MKLNNKDKTKLRKLANSLRPFVIIGKDGLDYNIINTLEDNLKAQELVKVSILKSCKVSLEEAIDYCTSYTNSNLVHKIGRTFVLYKRSKENKLKL